MQTLRNRNRERHLGRLGKPTEIFLRRKGGLKGSDWVNEEQDSIPKGEPWLPAKTAFWQEKGPTSSGSLTSVFLCV